MKKIVVFLGPSLKITEAHEIAPNAVFLPPAQCGDILKVLRLNPSVIALIDGVFEHTASVWHKEILYALEKKVVVMGASSMGALRAAELTDHGMIGIGKIFADYYQQHIVDDDEVAILHAPADKNYLTLTDALVNIRATLEAAVAQKIIPPSTAERIVALSKKMNYRERKLTAALTLADLNPEITARLTHWLRAGGYVDQKRLDAIALLEKLATADRYKINNTIQNPRTAFFRVLQKNIMCSPISNDWVDSLPTISVQEKVIATAANHLGDAYLLTRRIAFLLSTVYHFTAQKTQEFPLENHILGLPIDLLSPQGCQKYDCTLEERTDFLIRMNQIDRLLQQHRLNTKRDEPQDYFLMHLRLWGDYRKYKLLAGPQADEEKVASLFKHQEPRKYVLLYIIALLWWFLAQQIAACNLQPTADSLQKHSDQFRRKFDLLTQKDTEQWLSENDMDEKKYQDLITLRCHYSDLVLGNNLDRFQLNYHDTDQFWLRDALWLTGLYQDAKDIFLRIHNKKLTLPN